MQTIQVVFIDSLYITSPNWRLIDTSTSEQLASVL